jgi:TonB family protein
MKHICFSLLLASGLLFVEPPEWRWIHFEPPVYPSIARSAHIMGEVKLEVELNPDGTFKQLRGATGHAILVQAAVESAKRSRVVCDNCEDGYLPVFSIVYNFRI